MNRKPDKIIRFGAGQVGNTFTIVFPNGCMIYRESRLVSTVLYFADQSQPAAPGSYIGN